MSEPTVTLPSLPKPPSAFRCGVSGAYGSRRPICQGHKVFFVAFVFFVVILRLLSKSTYHRPADKLLRFKAQQPRSQHIDAHAERAQRGDEQKRAPFAAGHAD